MVQDSPMREPAENFLTLRAFGAPPIVIALAAQGAFRGFMDTKTPLYAIGKYCSTPFLSLFICLFLHQSSYLSISMYVCSCCFQLYVRQDHMFRLVQYLCSAESILQYSCSENYLYIHKNWLKHILDSLTHGDHSLLELAILKTC